MKRSIIVLLSAAVLTGFASLASAEVKIGVVNTAKLMQEAPQALAASNSLRAEFESRTKEIQALDQLLKTRQDKLQKDAATMTELQRAAADRELQVGSRELKQKQDAAQEDFDARREEEMTRLQNTVRQEVQAFAKAQNYDLILADGVVYATATYDVTGPILESLKRKAGGAAAPAAAPAARPAPAAPTPAKP